MATFEEAALVWAQDVNDWYKIEATVEEVKSVFDSHFKDMDAYDGTSYVEMFFKKKDGTWSKHLDTADREELADQVEISRGNSPLPTYADLGGNLLNKVRK
jgi:hypothetical protein